MIGLDVGRNLRLPLVSVQQQLLLIVQQLLVRLRGEFKVRTLDDGVHGTGLLTEATVNTLCHIDVVSRGPSTAVSTLLRLDRNGLGRTNGLAQLASNAPLLATRITTQRVLSAEPGTEWSLLEGVVDRSWLLEEMCQGDRETSDHFSHEHCGRRSFHQFVCLHAGLVSVHKHIVARPLSTGTGRGYRGSASDPDPWTCNLLLF